MYSDSENMLAELSDASIKVNHSDSDQETSKPSKKRKILFKPNSRVQKKKLYSDLKRKLMKIIPAVFEKDKERGDCIYDLMCDIIRMNNLIDTVDDVRCVEFLITEQRIKRALSHFFNVGKPTNDDTNNGILSSFMSPYREQFYEISMLGSGGFGTVYKAQHKLDRVTYAIKKIKMKARNRKQINQSLEEVRTLAQLHHPNIVAYKQAWIEFKTPSQNGSGSSQSSSSFESESNLTSVNAGFEFFNIDNKRCKSLCTYEQQDSSQENCEHEKEPVLILYIQMNLCSLNLREWMDARKKPSSTSDIDKIATQVLSGLSYIHDLNVAHHDINPKNIFILNKYGDAHNYHVQIGDFGLACVLNNNLDDNVHSQEFGTNPYVAPEQSAKICDPKSDIYSFGIILFELVVPMTSYMERSLKIEDLKNGTLPVSLVESYSKYRDIIVSTVIEDPAKRPSAKSLLESMRRNNHFKMENLRDENEKLKEENRQLRTMFAIAREKRIFLSPSQSPPAHRE